MFMDTRQTEFEQMQSALLTLVDKMGKHHDQGVRFGIETRLFPAEIHTVAAIGEGEGITVTQLAVRMQVSKPTISERIKRLVAKGVVQKQSVPDNAKAVTLWLTPDGKTACASHAAYHEQMYAVFRRCFGKEAEQKANLFKAVIKEISAWMDCLEEKG
ncbi:MarR family winged helix-turn-helix transcriptional regulator [Pseudodesulfovibrio sp.]|uniref:MarR family winged helix-turn-helix transcriptional regulator n=1 Tax=unclassified Pseudodesulfovibrio TaxID=2661612 RepID=UPI003B00DA1A